MSLTTVRQEAANRFQEAQSFLSAIKNLEEARRQHADEINVRKGLFLVLLYGAFEYSLTRTLTEATILINACRVEYGHMNETLYGLALDPQLTSLTAPGAGRDSKWQRRAELFRKQACADPVVLFDGAFASELQNAWANTIQKMFYVFGIMQPALYNPRVKQYINEVVDKRNAVAHGRESAATTGQAYTTGSLQNLNDQLSKQTQYIFSVFENHISAKAFVKVAHQSLY
jgi:RiboL-PSP-HEPN